MINKIIYKLIRPIFVLYMKIAYNPIVVGKNNIPKGKCVLIANHKSNLDFISMGITTKRNIHFLAKSSLFKGVLKIILNSCGIIPVDRSKKDKTVIPKCKDLLQKGEIIGIFPEGTFNKTDKVISEFKIGAVKLAFDMNVPIVPIAIGKYKRKMKVIVGGKIYVKDSNLTLENKRIMQIMEEMIISSEE